MHSLILATLALAGSTISLGCLLGMAWLLRPTPRYVRSTAAQSA